MALNTVSSDRLSTNVKNTNFTAAEKQDLTNDILPLAGQLGNKNKVINGEMTVSQRHGTSNISQTTSSQYLVDRFTSAIGSSCNLDTTISQSTDTPSGFKNSLKIEADSVVTPSGSQNGMIAQKFEGKDLQDFGFGTSDAKPITISWYAKTNATAAGNYTVKADFVSAVDNEHQSQYKLFAFTTSWTRFTYTLPATGTCLTEGIRDSTGTDFVIEFNLMCGPDDLTSEVTTWTANTGGTYQSVTGQKNFCDNASNELYITGVQLEVGSIATDFEHRSFGQEALLCKRYYQIIKGNSDLVMFGTGRASGTTAALVTTQLAVPLRASPTISSTSYTGWGTQGSHSVTATPTVQSFNETDNQLNMQFASLASLTNARVAVVSCNSGSNLVMDSEL